MKAEFLNMSLGEGALYSLIGFIIVLAVLALLVGIFYLSGFLFQSGLLSKKQKDTAVAPVENGDETDDQVVAAITAAVACILQEENGCTEAPDFVIKRISRKK